METICQNFFDFLKITFQDIRSSKRTAILHKAVLEQFLLEYPQYKKYDWKYEWTILNDGFNGSFKIDIVGFLKNEPKIAILCKSINSCFGKNSKNFASSLIGDTVRVLESKPEVFDKVFLINVMPRKIPVFDKNGKVKRLDLANSYHHRSNISVFLKKIYGDKASLIRIYYDIQNINSFKDRSNFHEIIPENITGFKDAS
jgi:hypothetical protein